MTKITFTAADLVDARGKVNIGMSIEETQRILNIYLESLAENKGLSLNELYAEGCST